jgi:hypothetical protein
MENNSLGPKTEVLNHPESLVREIFRTSLPTDHPQEELRFILFFAGDSKWLNLEVYQGQDKDQAGAQVRLVTLPLSLWPPFHAAVCCLGAFMKPLPAPAYQARSCCSYLCPQTPEPVVLEQADQIQIHLSFQDRRGSTFLEIKAVKPPAAKNSGETQTIRIGPTFWSGFLNVVRRIDQIITDL